MIPVAKLNDVLHHVRHRDQIQKVEAKEPSFFKLVNRHRRGRRQVDHRQAPPPNARLDIPKHVSVPRSGLRV